MDTTTHPTQLVMTPGSQEGIRQDTAGVNKALLGSDRLGRNHTGKHGLHTRPVLVFRAMLGAQNTAPWAMDLTGLLNAEATMEGQGRMKSRV